MTTKDEFLFIKGKYRSFGNDICQTNNENRNLNLSLNQNQKCPILIPVQSFSKSYKKKYYDSTASENFEETEKSQSWKKSSNLCFTTLKLNDEAVKEDKKRWKRDDSSNINNSTLSLHIADYENSNAAVANNTFGGKKNESLENKAIIRKEQSPEHEFTASTFVIKNPFEFPRQQIDEIRAPELSQYKSLQQLLNPNEVSKDGRQSVEQQSDGRDETPPPILYAEMPINYTLKRTRYQNRMSTDSGSDSSAEDRRPLASGRRRKSAINYGKIVEDMSITDFSGFDIFNADDDDLSLRYAAANSRLPFDRLSAEELNYFADIVQSKASKNLYLYLRNRCLQIWHMGPQVQLTYEAFKDQIKSPLNSDLNLLQRVHAFLERHCYINYGLFHVTVRKSPTIRRKIIVVGAGYAGLMAALQLRFFGFDVVLLEGRPRTGGRVMTYRFDNKQGVKGCGDLGGMIVMGIVGNPIMTIVQQSPIRLVQLSQQSVIYERNGERIPIEKDHHIQQAFDCLLDTCSYISKELKINSLNGKPLSLGATIDLICNQMELRVQHRRVTYWTSLHSLADRQRRLLDECYVLGNDIKRLQAEIDKAFKNKEDFLFEVDINKIRNLQELNRLLELRCYRRDLKIAIEKFKTKAAEIDTQRMHYKELLRAEPCQVYMNAHDKTIVNFHKANLEYANGCPLHKVSLEYWDADDEWDLDGSHFMVKGGYGKVTNVISDAIKDITKKSHLVTNIEIIDGGVRVKGIQEGVPDKPVFEEKAAAVIVTLPLGVLKCSLENPAVKDNLRVNFTPPLPKWKTKAIENMGFGSLNKAVLFFEKPFWGPQEDIFSRLSETTEARGECFQFFAVPKEPVLIALISGTAANIGDGPENDKLLKNRTMLFLRSTFPNCPVEPIEFIVTRWHRDKFARGCYSYVSVDAQDRDHEVLGEPICDTLGTPRIFFGGEHTICRWPSTVHGAMLSGMREATRVADTFYGTLPVVAHEDLISKIKLESMNGVKRGEDEDVKLEEESDIDFELSDDEQMPSETIDEKEAEKLLA